jgi:carboxypeptidase Q
MGDLESDADLNGKYVIAEQDLCLDIDGLFAEYDYATRVEMVARERGAKGILFMSSRPKKLLYRFLTMEATDNQMPQWVVAREDAKRIIRLLKEGHSLTFSSSIEAITGEAFTSHNVIAEIPGTSRKDEVVIIGAHFDSWALGTGANDNGCNVAMMIDLARQMKALNIRPERTIRFALWNGEEQGIFWITGIYTRPRYGPAQTGDFHRHR